MFKKITVNIFKQNKIILGWKRKDNSQFLLASPNLFKQSIINNI